MTGRGSRVAGGGARFVAGVVLAGGSGSRFGGRKQVAPFEGRPLLEHAVAAMNAARFVDRVVVVLGADADVVRAEVDVGAADVIVCEGWAEGQAASLRAGVAAAAAANAVVVTLGDQPHIAPEAIDRVVEAGGTARATYDGVPGHPVLLGNSLFPAIAELRGDVGARVLLRDVHVTDVPCDGLGSPADVDTAGDLDPS